MILFERGRERGASRCRGYSLKNIAPFALVSPPPPGARSMRESFPRFLKYGFREIKEKSAALSGLFSDGSFYHAESFSGGLCNYEYAKVAIVVMEIDACRV